MTSRYFTQKMRVLSVLMSTLLFVACSEDQINDLLLPGGAEQPVVLATFPADNAVGVGSAIEPWVMFDRPMDQEKTQSSFQLTTESGTVTGRFRWELTRMIFQPSAPLTDAGIHTMTIGRASESDSGVDLPSDVVVRFNPGTDSAGPEFTSSSPAANSVGVAVNATVTLNFSEAIAFSSIDNGISISPTVSYTVSQSSDLTQVVLTPAANLTPGTYTVSVNTGLTDTAGNPLTSSAQFNFTVGSDFTAPSVTTVQSGAVVFTEAVAATNVEKIDPIVITFSEGMDQVPSQDAVSLLPSTTVVRSWNAGSNQLTLTFPTPLESETRYTLTINATAQDPSSNALDKTYFYQFDTDGPNSIRPTISQVRQENVTTPGGVDGAVGSGAYTGPLSDFSLLDVTQLLDTDTAAGCCYQTILVRVDFNNAMDRNSLVANSTFSAVVDASAGSMAIRDIVVVGTQATYHFDGTPFPTAPGTPIYRLRIAAGAVDANGNSLENNYDLFLTF